MKKQNAFTLIELMIVVAIFAILAAVAIPKFCEIKENVRRKHLGLPAVQLATISYCSKCGQKLP